MSNQAPIDSIRRRAQTWQVQCGFAGPTRYPICSAAVAERRPARCCAVEAAPHRPFRNRALFHNASTGLWLRRGATTEGATKGASGL